MRILLATDGSQGAINAAHFVASTPLGAETSIAMLAVTPLDGSDNGDASFGPLESVLAGSTARLERLVRHGVPAEEILCVEESLGPDLLVLGSGGLSGIPRFWTGSVADRVAVESRSTVLVVWPQHHRVQRAVVGVDHSASSTSAVCWLRRFPMLVNAEVHLASFISLVEVFSRWRSRPMSPAPALLRVLERQESRRAEQRLHQLAGVLRSSVAAVRAHVRSGDPAAGLLRLADERAADLMVVGSRGYGLLGALTLSGVSDTLLARQRRSLLIVKPARGEGSHEDMV